MAGKNVLIGCRLPSGIWIDLPSAPIQSVLLKGANSDATLNRAVLVLTEDNYGETEIDADLWEGWKALNKDFAPFKSGAIFEAKSAADLKAAAKERAKEKTGFEGMDATAAGVAPVSE